MLLSLRKITKHFPVDRGLFGKPTAFVKAVNDVSLEIEEGEIVGVVGESGCGKTTLGRCAVGLHEPTTGEVQWKGEVLAKLSPEARRESRRFFQMVFQNPFASLNPRQKVGELLQEPMEVHGLFQPKDRKEAVLGLLAQVGLSPSDIHKYPHEFSGGQRQRIGLARALACQPSLMVLDEPVSSLDVSVQAAILNLFAELNRTQKISYLFISHDLQVVGYLSDRVLVMYLGQVVEEGKTGDVLGNPRHPYTRILMASSVGQGSSVKGEPPSPVNIPQGCTFHPRCPFAEKRCLEEKQELLGAEKGWKVACWKWDRVSAENDPRNKV